MASNFSSLRNSRKNLLSKLSEEIKRETSKAGQDERFWKLSIDQKTGVGYARLRFLPAPQGEELPWVRSFQHAFKGPTGAWLIENCPTTLGQRPCPICKENSRLWNTNDKNNQKIASDRKRKLNFISNILVLEDPAHPENNGKVFLFKYGKKIHEKITDLIEPQFPDRQPADPFDIWSGCEFKLKSQKKDNFINYDKSEFSDPTELYPGDETAKETIWSSEKPLVEFVDEKQFKNYDDLEKRLNAVLTGQQSGPATAADAIKQESSLTDDEVKAVVEDSKAEESKPRASKPRTPAQKPAPVTVAATPVDDALPDDEADLRKFFEKVVD